MQMFSLGENLPEMSISISQKNLFNLLSDELAKGVVTL